MNSAVIAKGAAGTGIFRTPILEWNARIIVQSHFK
jgi:hypothetical protein